MVKKIIVIFNTLGGFQHQDDNIQIIVIEKNSKYESKENMRYVENCNIDYKDNYYGSYKFNNFDPKYIREALKKLKLE